VTNRHILVIMGTTVSILAVSVALVMAAPAFASGIGIAVGAPEGVSVGQDVEVKAVLSEDGVPVEGAEIALTYQASMAGESARVVLATATTDETGTAVMIYQQRADDNGEMQVVYLGPDTDPVEPYTFTIAVEEGGQQLYVNESGVEIPFVNGTLVILVIAGVWFLIALSAIYLVRVGRAGRLPGAPIAEDGSMWISVLLASAAVFTAVGMVIVFIRAPVSNKDVTDPAVYDRTPIVYIDESYPYTGFGLNDRSAAQSYTGFGLNDESAAQTGDPVVDGSALYFKYGCAACHGLNGQGATVGPTLVDEIGSFGSFAEDTREGPGGMPSYDETTISEENLEKIYAYLKEGG